MDVCVEARQTESRKQGQRGAQSSRVGFREKGAVNVRSSFFAVSRSICFATNSVQMKAQKIEGRTFTRQGSVTTAFRSTVSTRGSRSAMSLIHE